MYLNYCLAFLPFGTLAFLSSYFPAANTNGADPPLQTAAIAFALMALAYRRTFFRIDRPFRNEATERFVSACFFGGCYAGFACLMAINSIGEQSFEPLRSGLASLGNLAGFVLAYVVIRIYFFEKSDPKNNSRSGGCCGGHHH